MARRFLPYLFAVLVVAVSFSALAVRPATGAAQDAVDYVVLAGVPGLRWDDVDPGNTPTLWRMAEAGAIGSLSVRSARRPTCPVDGWLTLGAGNYAAANGGRVTGRCPPMAVEVQRPDPIGASLPQQRRVVRYNQQRQPWGAVPGALAESVRCTVAVGPGAAVAAARPFGRVDRYAPTPPADLRALLSSCVLSVVDLGTVGGDDPAGRAAAARRADAELARVLAARPERSLVIVAGLADTDTPARLHVAVADGPGWGRGWLTSASTGREGYVQLVDLAPTALAALGRTLPERLFAGKPASVVGGRPADLSAAKTVPTDADRQARAQREISTGFLALLTGVQVLLFITVVPLMRRARLHAGPTGPAPPSRRLVTAVEVLLVAAALIIPAALVADAVPWWRADRPGPLFTLATLAAVVAGTIGVRASRPYRATLGPMGLVAAVAALVVAADLLTGARLQLNGVTGYSALDGARYAGLGSVGLGVLVAGALLAAGCLAQRVRRPWRPLVVVVVGGVAVILVGSPYLGADPIGAIAVTAGVCVAAAISTGGWLTLARFAWATLAGLAVMIGFAVLDLRRPVGERGALGRFLTALGEGTGGPAVHRAAASNMRALVDSPLTVLAVAGALLLAFALFSPWGGLKRLFGLHPAVRAAMAGTAVAALMAGALAGSALQVAGAAAAVTVPLAALTALRVLDHAADRTRPPVVPVTEPVTPGDRPAPDLPVPFRPAAAAGPAGPSAAGAADRHADGGADGSPARASTAP
jgi:hypothetical protein